MRSRPTGVLVIAAYYFLCGAAAIAVTIWLLMASADTSRIPFGGAEIAKYLLLIAVITAAIGVGYLATGWGLSQLRQWAQAAAIVVAGLSLLVDMAMIVLLSVGGGLVPLQFYFCVGTYGLLSLGIIGYLLTRDIASAFGAPVGVTANTSCPNCLQPGIRPGMTVCPYCRQSLLAPAQWQNSATYAGAVQSAEDLRYGETVPALDIAPAVVSKRVGSPQVAALGWLVIKAGPGTGKRLDLGDDNAIGRDTQCQIPLSDDHVSRQHARVKYEAGQFFIYDIGSSGGTFVNRRQVQRVMLYDGAVIRVGNTTLEFKKTASTH
jgi:pSer/pThr/pTyr-binding forkhead associated (FHA) protein